MPHVHERTLVQLERIIDDPFIFIQMLTASMKEYNDFYLKGFIGFAGWLTTPIAEKPMLIASMTIVLWLMYSIFKTKEKSLQYTATLLISIGVTLICIILIFLSMFLYWTHPERPLIEGVQGRYFLPLIFFITPILFSTRLNDKIHIEYIIPFALLTATTVVFLVRTVIPFFHG